MVAPDADDRVTIGTLCASIATVRIVLADEPSSAAGPGREDLEAERNTIDRHLLRVQRRRFEANAREDAPSIQRRLDREFRRTQQRRGDVLRALEQLGSKN